MRADPVIVLLAGDDQWSRMIYHALSADHPVSRVIFENPVSRWAFLLRRARRLGATRVAGQMLFRLGIYPLLRGASAARRAEIIAECGLDATDPQAERVTRVASANGSDCVTLLRSLAPDVVVINGVRILSREVLRSVPAPFINMHAGITPLYRGVHGAYWALRNGRPGECGVTIHRVDEGIDTGGILGQATIRPTSRDDFTTYQVLQWAAGLPLLRAAVDRAIAGDLRTIPPPSGASHLWSHPTAWDYLRGRLVHHVR